MQSAITYFCLWPKPKAVETPTLIATWNYNVRSMENQLIISKRNE